MLAARLLNRMPQKTMHKPLEKVTKVLLLVAERWNPGEFSGLESRVAKLRVGQSLVLRIHILPSLWYKG
jgi:hypothetical protein